MMIRIFLLAVLLLVPLHAWAGVTIHYDGQLKEGVPHDDVTRTACEVAKAQAWTCSPITGGVVIQPDPMSEPLNLIFDAGGNFSDFCKTQFAGSDVHIGVIAVFDAIKPFFARLDIEDEGDYWVGRDRATLDAQIASVNSQIEAIKAQHPSAHGPIKLPDGRIIDLAAE